MANTRFKGQFVNRPKSSDYGLDTGPSELVEQCHLDTCDINSIIRRSARGEVIEHLAQMQPRYGDFLDVEDYHTAMSKIADARSVFEALPSDLRESLGNDVSNFLEFVHDPKNSEELVELGLAVAKPNSAKSPELPESAEHLSDLPRI